MAQAFRLTSALSTALIGSAAILNMTATSASAGTFGEFQFGGGTLIPFIEATDVSLTSNGINLDFDPEPITPIGIVNQTGIFAGFDTGQIQDIISFGPPTIVDNPFIDLGTGNIAPGITTLPNPSLTDGENVFNLSNASYRLSQSGANVAIDVDLFGEFIIGNDAYNGAGTLTFQTNNTTVADIEFTLANGGSIDDMTFSGALFKAEVVPEPLTILGAGTAIAFGTGFKRKLDKAKKK